MLYIRSNSSLPTTWDKAIELKIVGVVNPLISTNNPNSYFLCTMNETNFITWVRRTLVKWLTQLNEWINYPSDTAFWNIRIFNAYTQYTTSIPTTNSNTQNLWWQSVNWIE